MHFKADWGAESLPAVAGFRNHVGHRMRGRVSGRRLGLRAALFPTFAIILRP